MARLEKQLRRIMHPQEDRLIALDLGGRIRADDLLGEPDLLRKEAGGHVCGDIKSGAGLEGTSENSDGKPKRNYTVQIALYVDVLAVSRVSVA